MVVNDEQHFKNHYEVEEAMYNDRILEYVQSVNPSCIYLYDGVDSDSGLRPRLPDLRNFGNFLLNQTELYAILNEQRTVKDETELDIMRFITKIASDAHIHVM